MSTITLRDASGAVIQQVNDAAILEVEANGRKVKIDAQNGVIWCDDVKPNADFYQVHDGVGSVAFARLGTSGGQRVLYLGDSALPIKLLSSQPFSPASGTVEERLAHVEAVLNAVLD